MLLALRQLPKHRGARHLRFLHPLLHAQREFALEGGGMRGVLERGTGFVQCTLALSRHAQGPCGGRVQPNISQRALPRVWRNTCACVLTTPEHGP
eukprot:6203599-Pleurochrysis_carterae.AAC.5